MDTAGGVLHLVKLVSGVAADNGHGNASDDARSRADAVCHQPNHDGSKCAAFDKLQRV